MCPPMRTHWCHLANTIQHVLSWAHPNPNDKSIGSAVFRTDDRRVSLYFTTGRPFPLKIAPSHGGSGPSFNT